MTTEKETPVTQSWLTRVLGGIALRVNERFDTTEGKVLKLIERVAALEAHTKNFSYLGVWSPGNYKRHNCATHGGSLWICRADQTTQRPGDGPDWQLAVKHGRDAR